MSGSVDKMLRMVAWLTGKKESTIKRWWNEIPEAERGETREGLQHIIDTYEKVKADPVIVDEDGNILDGRERYNLLKMMKFPDNKIPMEVRRTNRFKKALRAKNNSKPNSEDI